MAVNYLSAEDAESLASAKTSAVSAYMHRDQPPANLVGFGVGVRHRGGEPTGEKAVIALVERKLEPGELAKDDLLPKDFDVIEVGQITAYPTYTTAELTARPLVGPPAHDGALLVEAAPAAAPAAVPAAPYVPLFGPGQLTNRMRPCPGGFSIGHYRITAGTMSTAVYDILPGGSVSPPHAGYGNPPQWYVLSNNHVLANSNLAMIGDPILQPGPISGGTSSADKIALLQRFIPIQFFPPVPLAQHKNVVDCAIGTADLQNIDREIYWIGEVRGWKLKKARVGYPKPVEVGLDVQKTGMRTGWTAGKVLAINATVDVGYGIGTARFNDQMLVQNPVTKQAIGAPGDSGSLVLDLDNVAVGLLFAGSEVITVCNQIENVRALLRVEVAQRIL
jgi:hypothetical protein